MTPGCLYVPSVSICALMLLEYSFEYPTLLSCRIQFQSPISFLTSEQKQREEGLLVVTISFFSNVQQMKSSSL